jgi:alpha-D-xyloside xylohydrolase
MPLFVRAGSILPYGPALQYTSEKAADPLELRIYRGADGDFTLYEDESDNYNYERGAFATITMHWEERTQTLSLGARQGEFPGMLHERTFHVVSVGMNHGVGVFSSENEDIDIRYTGAQVAVILPH